MAAETYLKTTAFLTCSHPPSRSTFCKRIALALPAAHGLALLSGYFFVQLAGGVLGLICWIPVTPFTTTGSERDVWMPRWRGDSNSGDKKFIDCPDAERLFERVFRSSPSEYSVIVGRYGTGKPTLAKKAARKTPGVIYVIPSWLEMGGMGVVDALDSASGMVGYTMMKQKTIIFPPKHLKKVIDEAEKQENPMVQRA